MQKNIFVFS